MSSNLRVKGRYANNREWLDSKKLVLVVTLVLMTLVLASEVSVRTKPNVALFSQEIPQKVRAVEQTGNSAPTPVPVSEKQQILHYIVEKFGDRADDAITMLNKCENNSLRTDVINKANRNGTRDVGVWQINVDPSDTKEVERLKDWKYNTDKAYAKYKAHKNTFYLWTCGGTVGDYTYLDRIRGNK